jgi:hypothetical protein
MQITVAQPVQASRPLLLPVSSTALYLWLLTGLTLFGFVLRLRLLDRFPLREDEALSTHARSGTAPALHNDGDRDLAEPVA